jgi:hypothetical protein
VGSEAVEEIAAAARTTLAAGSARVRERVFSDPPRSTPFDIDFDFDVVKEGVTDLARRRTRVEQSMTAWEGLSERLLKRFPASIAGDVWIDSAGRIRRVTWTTFAVRRPRSPLRTNGAQSAWHTTELWDFGIDVDIELPDIRNQDVEVRSWPVVLYGLFGEMWRARRAYARRERAQPGPGSAK